MNPLPDDDGNDDDDDDDDDCPCDRTWYNLFRMAASVEPSMMELQQLHLPPH